MTGLTGIFGAGGCGRGIMPLARSMRQQAGHRLVFINEGLKAGEIVNGHIIMPFDQYMNDAAPNKQVAIAVADPAVRFKIAEQLSQHDVPLISIWSEQSQVMDDVRSAKVLWFRLMSPSPPISAWGAVSMLIYTRMSSMIA